MTVGDTGVEMKGSSLSGHRIIVGVTGGIAAVDTVRLLRELRRHGAELLVIMTESAQRVITPLAVEWASQCEVITNWDGDMKQLEDADAILVAPATRNTIAAHLQGMQQGPDGCRVYLFEGAGRERSQPQQTYQTRAQRATQSPPPVFGT